MEHSTEPREFHLPLELQFSMRRVELAAQEMTWDELYNTFLHLYHQRLMEWHAIKELMADENINLDWDLPTDIEMMHIAASCSNDDDDEDGEMLCQPF